MPRKRSGDLSYLEKHGAHYRVTLGVPKELHKVLGTRLKKSLGTDSLIIANALKHGVLQELRDRIDQAAEQVAGKPRALIREAAQIRALYREMEGGARDAGADVLARAVLEREAEILGPEVRELIDPETGDAFPIYDERRKALADDFMAVATGSATPLALHHEQYLATLTVTRRTRADDVRALRYLVAWCEKERVPATLQGMTKARATRFLADLGGMAGGIDPATKKKYLTRLNRYWVFLGNAYDWEANPWQGRQIPSAGKKEAERAFTDEELRRLLSGGASPKLHDVMMFGALTGARLDVIVRLKVGDCIDGGIRFQAAKGEETERDVPIHRDLVEIIERRSRGKAPDDALFHEWREPPPGSLRERSFYTSRCFTEYRRKLEVAHVVEGQRRSLVNFHSFRRWFTTAAERADMPANIISAVVGHAHGSITLDRYSAGPAWKQAKLLIDAIRLPPLDQGPVPEARPLKRTKR